ncbi:HemK2/MTQ2 family protein methyltransferase [Streptomyces sp. NRRL F-4489]|uniref:HemK2/MTQ2 family protein methyltransferase n=1 Tax=Streptomyces sp. NRRL F-4489 TaxID=1609095 RepID=UPI0008305BE4|nr:HemK2/MTQ2 family protein methyltransferase [Streptomyces sp. NRRL F-4489]
MGAVTVTLPQSRPVVKLPGVYPAQHDTQLLLRALYREDIGAGAEVLDLGTGCGALALGAARQGARVTAVDISWRAVLTTRVNAWWARQRVTVRQGDLTAAVRDRSFDLIVSNPPYVPTPGNGSSRGAARAWDAGRDGRLLIDRICDTAPGVLRPGGVLLMVHSGLCGAERTVRRLAEAGLPAAVSDRVRIPFGPVVRSRLAWLRSQGLLDGGQDTEELVIIRAQHPQRPQHAQHSQHPRTHHSPHPQRS